MIGEILLREKFLQEGIQVFTSLEQWGEHDEFILMTRVGYERVYHDYSHNFRDKEYALRLVVYSRGGLLKAATFFETVSDILEDLSMDAEVSLEISGGSALPEMDGYNGHSIALTLVMAS